VLFSLYKVYRRDSRPLMIVCTKLCVVLNYLSFQLQNMCSFHHNKLIFLDVLTVTVRTNYVTSSFEVYTEKESQFIQIHKYYSFWLELLWRSFEISYFSFPTKLLSCETPNLRKLSHLQTHNFKLWIFKFKIIYFFAKSKVEFREHFEFV